MNNQEQEQNSKSLKETLGDINEMREKLHNRQKLRELAALKAMRVFYVVRPFCIEHKLELTFEAGCISMRLASKKFETAFSMSWCRVMENGEDCDDIEIALVKKEDGEVHYNKAAGYECTNAIFGSIEDALEEILRLVRFFSRKQEKPEFYGHGDEEFQVLRKWVNNYPKMHNISHFIGKTGYDNKKFGYFCGKDLNIYRFETAWKEAESKLVYKRVNMYDTVKLYCSTAR